MKQNLSCEDLIYNIGNTSPPINTPNTINCYSYEQGVGYQPYLSVTYTIPVSAPTITTSAASSVTTTTATINGNITATGGANPTVTMYWGLSNGGTTPASWTYHATGASLTSPGTATEGVGAFYENLTGLITGDTYYFTAAATNAGGTSWASPVLSFVAGVTPTVTTQAITAITVSTATGNGNITATGGVNSTIEGIEWGHLPDQCLIK